MVHYRLLSYVTIQDINTPHITTDNVQEFGDADNTDFETVFVLTHFDTSDYDYLYKRDNRIVGPPLVLYCAAKEEASHLVNPFFKLRLVVC